MPADRRLIRLPVVVVACMLPLLAGSARAQDAITRPLDDNASELQRGGRAGTGSKPGVASGEKADTGAPVAQPTINGEVPQGLQLYQRMGAPLPPLPKDKPYKGPVDEAYGAYQRGLYLTALDKALPRAKKGDPAAQTLIAEMTERGLGIKRDPKAAAFWYQQAAAGGDPAGMFQYALILMNGNTVKQDKAKADEYMKKAADAGNASAQFNWAQILVSDNPGRKGLELGLPYYEKSADQGIADAQYAVAQLYNSLPGLDKSKRDLARDYLRKAARAGFDTAQFDMGIWLVNGINGPRDYEKGFRWMSIGANHGNVAAQNRLAHLYIEALGTRPDPVEAAKWYVLSRRAGMKDPDLEDFYLGLTDEQQKKAIDKANKFRLRAR
ncbi:tetratricopeptide repeat protein [Rhizobium halophytocola]|uniref:tetratricopeptide repeat protein n=1 Tax=Rhizobium halophytocola TaxID=735519 RepID=UPI003A969FC6